MEEEGKCEYVFRYIYAGVKEMKYRRERSLGI